MSDAKLTPSAFVAKAVEKFCIPMIAGGVPPMQSDAPWRWLTDEERRDNCGLTEPGKTAAFKLDAGFVFMDTANNRVQMWFQNIDARNALAAVEQALLRAAPLIGQFEDAENETDGMRLRTYAANVGSGRFARVAATYTATIKPPAADDRFKVVIVGLLQKPEDVGSIPKGMAAKVANTRDKKKKAH